MSRKIILKYVKKFDFINERHQIKTYPFLSTRLARIQKLNNTVCICGNLMGKTALAFIIALERKTE
jgi:hypothetical protein